MTDLIKKKVSELLESQKADRVLGWKKGEFFYDETPAVFTAEQGLEELVYDGFSAPNLSKYLIQESKKEGKVAALLKPCDTYSFNQLLMEHRINRENVYVVGVPCRGKLDINKIRAMGIKGIQSIKEEGDQLIIDTLYGQKTIDRKEAVLDRCFCCKGSQHMAADEVIESDAPAWQPEADRFEMVEKLEAMTPDERFDFWRGELSKCIRCNACRNVCPACSCIQCVFDNPASGVAAKANADEFEENLFHIIRAFHVAGRCTDCGECSRVCPQGIPLHLLNRKFIKDIDELYGEYQAGADLEAKGPLTEYTKTDVEPGIVSDTEARAALKRGGK